MRVLYRSVYEETVLTAGDIHYVVPSPAVIELDIDNNDNDYRVSFNGKPASVNDRKFFVDHPAANLVVKYADADRIIEYSIQPFPQPINEELGKAYYAFLEDWRKSCDNDFDCIEAITSGLIRLYALKQSAEIRNYLVIFNSLNESYIALKRICDAPKSHLRSINEIRPIDTVKRIGYESIPYLASHSEDWLARTASGLKPARLFSRVEDDEYQIYENRVIKTLIDLSLCFLKKCQHELEQKQSQLETIINSEVQTSGFGFDKGFAKAVSELLCADNQAPENYASQFKLANEQIALAKIIIKKYTVLRQSILYRYLKKSKSITNPLQETNILLLDRHYSVAFQLWKKLCRYLAPTQKDEDARITTYREIYQAVKLFIITLVKYTAHTLGFERQGNDTSYFRKSDSICIDIDEQDDLVIVKILDKSRRVLELNRQISCPIKPGETYKSFSLDFQGLCLSWDNDTTTEEIDDFCALFKQRNTYGQKADENRKRYQSLKSAITERQTKYRQEETFSIVFIPTACMLENDILIRFKDYMTEKAKLVLKRFKANLVVVSLADLDICEQKITSYAKKHNDSIAFLPLTLLDINSYRRIQNLILRFITRIDNNHCPYCGTAFRNGSNRHKCETCDLITTSTQCEVDSTHKFTYLSHELKPEIIERMQEIDHNHFNQHDSLFHYMDIVEMVVENGSVHPLCPLCDKNKYGEKNKNI